MGSPDPPNRQAGGVPTVGESEASEQGIRGLGRTRRAAQRTLGSVGREHTVMVDAMEVDGNGDGRGLTRGV